MALGQSLASLKEPVLPRILGRLPEQKSWFVIVVTFILGTKRKPAGPLFHQHIADLMRAELNTDDELQEWLAGKFTGLQVTWKSFDTARKQAERWFGEGKWVAAWSDGFSPPSHPSVSCPQAIFGQGSIEPDRFWATFFNSRKPKIVSPQAEWLRALRVLLPFLSAYNLGFASSLGTITYDLVTVGADQVGARLLLVLSTALDYRRQSGHIAVLEGASSPGLVLSCATEFMSCPKSMHLVCRDRLLASISDLHCLLELRPGGNLLRIIGNHGKNQSRLQWIYRPENFNQANTGNLKILQKHPRSAVGFSMKELDGDPKFPAATRGKGRAPRHSFQVIDVKEVRWEDYLYHYTRSCDGPWPGESHRGYLLSLLHDEPLAEHTAPAALVRMLAEGLIRASSRIVRGSQAVVSWTSVPPSGIKAIRRWNPALIRWTFEPFGIAVKRKVLRNHGAMPAIYAASATYEKLLPKDRFRFQLHEPPRCAWKEEREWRLPKDFDLTQLALDDVFGFAPLACDLEALAEQIPCAVPILMLELNG